MDCNQENITTMIKFMLDYYKVNKISCSRRLDLLEELLQDMTSNAYQTYLVNFDDVMKQLDELWILHLQKYFGLFDALFDLDKNSNLDQAIDFLSKLEQKMVTNWHLRQESSFQNKIKTLNQNFSDEKGKINCLKSFHSAFEIYNKAMILKTWMEKYKVGFNALACLEEAESLIASCHVQNKKIMSQIKCLMGIIYMDLLQDFDTAEEKFLESNKLNGIFHLRTVLQVNWRSFANLRLRQISLLKSQKIKQNPSLEEVFLKIQWKRTQGIIPLIEFVLKNHPPKHAAAFDQKKWKKPIQNVDKKILIKLITYYHTDKVDRSKFDADYFLIIEEIAKCLGEALARIKDDQ
jgi:hypothetical protein